MDNARMSMAEPPPGDGDNLLSMVASSLTPKVKKDVMSIAQEPGGADRLGVLAKHFVANPDQAKAVVNKPRQSVKDQQVEEEKKTSEVKKNLFNREALDSNSEWIRSQPEFKDQAAAADQLQNMISMTNGQGSDGASWIRPLSALADAQTGSHLAASAPDPAARQQTLLKYQDELAKRKQDMMKTIMEGASKLKTGQESQGQINDLKSLLLRQSGDLGSGRGGAYLLSLATRAGKDFDTQLKDATNSSEAFSRAGSFLDDKSHPLTPQNVNQVQQEITKGLLGSGNPTDAKTAMDLQELFAGALKTAKIKYTGKFDPAKDDMRIVAPEVLEQISKGLKKIRGDFNDAIHRQVGQIKKTYEPLYGMVPGLDGIVEGKSSYILNRHPKSQHFTDTGEFPSSPPPPAAAGSRKKSLADMSQAELDVYEASLHKAGG